MAETYRDQWEAAAAVLRSHAAEFDKLAKAAPPRPGAVSDALKVAVCEYLLQVNREMDEADAGGGRKFIPPTAINWLGDGIVRVVLAALNDGDDHG